MINELFLFCVKVLEIIGVATGMGYELANIVIFVFLQPALILLFFILWRKEKKSILIKYKGRSVSPSILIINRK